MTEFDPETATSFDVLGQEIRIGIVEALVEKRVEDPESPGASFSELRNRVGVADSGRFNYHLDKLTSRFVQETEEGYELNAAGQEVAGAILSGTFEIDGKWGPTELEAPCQKCGETVAAHYEDGMIFVECEEGHLNHRDYFPASIINRTSLPEAMRLATRMGQHDLELLVQDVCPKCYGEVESGVALEEGDPFFEGQCHRCGYFFQGPISLIILTHPVLQAFYLERDRDVREASLWTISFLTNPDRVHVRSKSPIRVVIDASYGGEELVFVIDDDCSVVEYNVGSWIAT